jgi:2-polyprenyl-3-methyl-5-hydroxy-6-metoxy-1,4-benzoquinol methylase
MINKYNIKSYQEWKNWTDEDFALVSIEEQLYFSKLRRKFKLVNNLDVLEIGFGNGSFLDFSRKVGWNISGVELHPNLISIATRDGFEVFDNIYEIPKNNKYDLIVALDVLEHIESDDFPKFFAKIKNCLNPEGTILIRTPNGSSPFGLANQYGDVTHKSVITESKMQHWANIVDLEIDFSGRDIYLIYNGKFMKMPIRAIKRILQLLIEKIVRWIFSPQSKGFLSANSIYVLSLKK